MLLFSKFQTLDKFLAASLTTLSTMVALECPSINVLTKLDLLSTKDREFVEVLLEGDIKSLLATAMPPQQSTNGTIGSDAEPKINLSDDAAIAWSAHRRKLTEAIATVVDDYSLVKFVPLNADDEDTVAEVLLLIDTTIQYGENLDVKDRYPEEDGDGDNIE